MQHRVSVLVDGDNSSSDHAAAILDRAARHGTVDFARVYGNACGLAGWRAAPGYRFVHSGTGKNATDLLLTVQAMDRALSGQCDRVLIVSSDGDFVHLATHLRERGVSVIGIGDAKAPQAFRAACSVFEILGTPAQPVGTVAELDRTIRNIIAAHSNNGLGMRITALSSAMYSQKGIRISTFPERTWRGYLGQRGTLYDLDPKGPEARVRFIRAGFNEVVAGAA